MVYKYGSFNRPLDFIYPGDLSQSFEVIHNKWPLKEGQPHSIIKVHKPLTEKEIKEYELTPMGVKIYYLILNGTKQIGNIEACSIEAAHEYFKDYMPRGMDAEVHQNNWIAMDPEDNVYEIREMGLVDSKDE